MGEKTDQEYSEEEVQRRFDQALRGAQLAEPTPMKDVPPKRPKKQRKAKSPPKPHSKIAGASKKKSPK